MRDRKRSPERRLKDQTITYLRRMKRRPMVWVDYRALEREMHA